MRGGARNLTTTQSVMRPCVNQVVHTTTGMCAHGHARCPDTKNRVVKTQTGKSARSTFVKLWIDVVSQSLIAGLFFPCRLAGFFRIRFPWKAQFMWNLQPPATSHLVVSRQSSPDSRDWAWCGKRTCVTCSVSFLVQEGKLVFNQVWSEGNKETQS